MWLDVVRGLSRLYGVVEWVAVVVVFGLLAGGCSLVFWGGGDSFRFQLKDTWFKR